MGRRLAAIMAADIAGYSRMMSEDETGALDRPAALPLRAGRSCHRTGTRAASSS